MKYEISERVQHENYCCEISFIQDVIDTLLNENLDIDQIHIIADKYLTEIILKTICQIQIDGFDFSIQLLDFNKYNDEIDEYTITISTDGYVLVEPAINKNAEYYELDGFMFVESEVSEDAYGGNNRDNDVMVFSIDEY